MTDPVRRPEYDGRIVYLPDVACLRPGDILLTRDAESGQVKGLAMSKTIQVATGGTFSHALICSAPPTFVEAIDTGVSTLTLARCFTHSLENVRVLRHPDGAAAARAAQHAQFSVGRSYSKRKAVASVFPDAVMDEIKSSGIFCSALVAQCFLDAGASGFAGVRVSKTTPATLEFMAGLVDVTAQVFHPKLSPPNIEMMSALDGARVATPSSRQTDINRRYADQLVPLADGLLDQFPETGLEAPITFFDVLQFIVRAMDTRDAVAGPRQAEYDAAVGVLDEMAATLIASGELSAVHEDLARLDAESIQRDLADSFSPNPNISLSAMRNIAQTTRGQIRTRETSDQGLVDWSRGRSQAIAAWVAFHAPIIATMKTNLVVFNEILGRLDPKGPSVL